MPTVLTTTAWNNGKRDDGGFALRISKNMPIAQRRIKARAGLPY